MKATRLLTALIVITIFGIAATAQNQPIRWRTTAKMTSPTEGILTVRAIISDGWHLYDMTLPKGGPVPTTLDFSKSTGIKWLGQFKTSSKPVSSHDASFDMTLRWWKKDVIFTRQFRLTGDVSDASIDGIINYMACNGSTCNPPKKQTVKLKVKAYQSK